MSEHQENSLASNIYIKTLDFFEYRILSLDRSNISYKVILSLKHLFLIVPLKSKIDHLIVVDCETIQNTLLISITHNMIFIDYW